VTGATAELGAYLERPLTPPATDALAAVERGPMDAADVLAIADVDRLLDPAPVAVETGWCWLPDGVAYVAARTEMPGVSSEMVEWWFDWHPRDPLRYRIWHPPGHTSNAVDLPDTPQAKKHWHAVHHPVEDVGTGAAHARIAFLPPTEVGFSTDALDDPRVAAIVAGFVGDDRSRLRHSRMVHVWLREGDGTVLRSRFWMGAELPRLLNRPFVRRRALPRRLPPALARHCLEEYANLAALLPELYARYGP
jgi:phloretin hydrolase